MKLGEAVSKWDKPRKPDPWMSAVVLGLLLAGILLLYMEYNV